MDSLHNACADHDFHKCNITPSVNLFPIVPTDVDGNWTDGPVYIHLKDSIFEQSGPARHATELMYDMRDMLLLDGGNLSRVEAIDRAKFAVLLKYHDGGADHNITFASVQLASICEFLLTGVDMMVSMRTVPGQSWTNPAERIMSCINFGLQGVVVERSKIHPPTLEASIAKCNSMAAIRKALEHEPVARSRMTAALDSTKAKLTEALSRVHRNGERHSPKGIRNVAGQLWSTQSKGIPMPKVFEAKTIRNPKGLQFTVGSPQFLARRWRSRVVVGLSPTAAG